MTYEELVEKRRTLAADYAYRRSLGNLGAESQSILSLFEGLLDLFDHELMELRERREADAEIQAKVEAQAAVSASSSTESPREPAALPDGSGL
jgi:hypothetical protein